jgi:chromate reductase
VRAGWKPAEGVAQRNAGECADLARAILVEPETVKIGQLPLFNQDLETGVSPAQWTAFRQRVKAADAVLFVTPEYSRSMPAALKNALVSCSPSVIGAFGANHHLRQSLVFLNMPNMQQPEAYLGHADKLFDEHGRLVNDGTRQFLRDFMQAFANWVETTRSQRPRN